MAAISALGASDYSTTAGNKTASATPAVGDLLVAVCMNTGRTSAQPPTFSDTGAGGTWTRHGTAFVKNASADAGWIFVRDNLVASATSHTFNMTQSGDTGGGFAVFKITGMSKTGLSAIRQLGKQDNAATGTPSVTMGAAIITGNPVLGAVHTAQTGTANTAPPTGGYTETHDSGYNTPATGREICVRSSGETRTTVPWTAATTSAFGAVFVEFDAAAVVQAAAPTSLALTTFAPTIRLNKIATPPKTALALTTFAPTVTAPNNKRVTPTTTALALITFAPTIARPQRVTPGVSALTLSAFAPTVRTPRLVTPTTAALTLSAFAPNVSVESHGVTVTPDAAALALTTFAPTIRLPRLVTPTNAALVLATFTPTVLTPRQVVPATAALALAAFAPTVLTPRRVEPPVSSLTLTTFAPAIAISDHQRVVPASTALTLSGFAPTVRLPKLATPIAAGLTITTFAPGIYSGTTVVAQAAALALSTFAPEVATTANLRVVPAPAALALNTFPPEVGRSALVVVDSALLTLTTFPPDVDISGVSGLFDGEEVASVSVMAGLSASVSIDSNSGEVSLVPAGSAEVVLH